MAAMAQAQAEATKAAQRAGIEHAKLNDDRAYLGRKPSFTRQQLDTARGILGRKRHDASTVTVFAPSE
jgi:putative DNA-invertase from lambdoid prophage Rac